LQRTFEVVEQHNKGQLEVNPASLGQVDLRDDEVKEREHSTHTTFMIISGLISAAGIGMAYQFHLKDRTAGEALAAQTSGWRRRWRTSIGSTSCTRK